MNLEGTYKKELFHKQSENLDYTNIIEDFIGKDRSIAWINKEDFEIKKDRFLFGFAEGKESEPDLFIKMTKIGVGNNTERLLDESRIMRAVQKLEISSVCQIHEYQEKAGYAFICFEKLDMEKGDLLANNELIASAPREYGTLAGQTLHVISGKEIPPDFDCTVFKNNDIRNRSLESFMAGWNESVKKVIDFDPNKQDVFKQGEINMVRKLIEELQAEIVLAQSKRNDNGKKYFVHNDASPNNIFFGTNGGETTPLDFEYAGVTENYLLARITDFGNFYSKLWPNPDLQKTFLSSIIEQSDTKNIDEIYHTTRVVVGYGSLFHTQYVIDPEHEEHYSARPDIDNMFKNIEFLRELYEEKKKRINE